MINVKWPTAVADKADIVSSVSASACYIGGPIGVSIRSCTLRCCRLLTNNREKMISEYGWCLTVDVRSPETYRAPSSHVRNGGVQEGHVVGRIRRPPSSIVWRSAGKRTSYHFSALLKVSLKELYLEKRTIVSLSMGQVARTSLRVNKK